MLYCRSFEIAVESRDSEFSQEFTLQDFLGERGVRDFCDDLLQSALKLQSGLLDSPMDQLIEGSDIRRLVVSPPARVIGNFCLETERVGSFVGVVFMQERCQIGPLQTWDGPTGLDLQFKARLPVVFTSGIFGGQRSVPGVGRYDTLAPLLYDLIGSIVSPSSFASQ